MSAVLPTPHSIAQFMNIDLDLGLTFVEIAKTTLDPDRKTRNQEHARKVCDKVEEYLATKHIPPEAVEEIEEKLSRLKQALAELGETF
jgi:hypothetical protein